MSASPLPRTSGSFRSSCAPHSRRWHRPRHRLQQDRIRGDLQGQGWHCRVTHAAGAHREVTPPIAGWKEYELEVMRDMADIVVFHREHRPHGFNCFAGATVMEFDRRSLTKITKGLGTTQRRSSGRLVLRVDAVVFLGVLNSGEDALASSTVALLLRSASDAPVLRQKADGTGRER
jgi:hypothetical protein